MIKLLLHLQALRIFFFFFNDTATTEIYTLSLHDALPISDLFVAVAGQVVGGGDADVVVLVVQVLHHRDRKSTRLNSSHVRISYAVFCLKKKKPKSYRYSNRSISPTTSPANMNPLRGVSPS